MTFITTIHGLELYLYCYYGKRTTDDYAAFGHRLYETNWMIFPNNLQKILVLMIAHAQKPVHFHGYHFVYLNLDLFVKVSPI